MKTKIALCIGGAESFVDSSCVKNWSEIACTYRRTDFSGVVRSFTTKFEFAGEAADMLLDAFLADGFGAEVKVSIWTMDNILQYHKQFECPLDFSTMQRMNGVLSISAIDNSIGAKIKANKGTKYEMDSSELAPDRTFIFDRVEMVEYATYEFTQGTSGDDGSLTVVHDDEQDGDRLWLGNVANEISVGGSILYKDDQETEQNSFLLQAYKRVVVNLDVEIEFDRRECNGANYNVYASVKSPRAFGYSRNIPLFNFGGEYPLLNKGTFSSESTLPPATADDQYNGAYAIIDEEVWIVVCDGGGYGWRNTNQSPDDYFKQTTTANVDIELLKGERVVIRTHNTSSTLTNCRVKVLSSRFHFSWHSRGDQIIIGSHSPLSVLNALLAKMCEGYNVRGKISTLDPRMPDTQILAAERIRNFPNARLYSSFSDFCSWMETVFGYTYCINEKPDGWEVEFLHRSELFPVTAARNTMQLAKDISHSITASEIYSAVEIGYEKKDYDSVSGRDEFNFSNTYSTGCSISEKKLQLISKYRADCYGIEFAAQKRSKETTDSDSDSDVFFVQVDGDGKPYRSGNIGNVLSDTVFNTYFTPVDCAFANEGYIGRQAESLLLTFASSTGNSDMTRGGGWSMNKNLVLDKRLLTVQEVQFTTSEYEEPDPSELICVEHDGMLYEGFLKEVEQRFAMEEAYTYKLLIRNIRRI